MDVRIVPSDVYDESLSGIEFGYDLWILSQYKQIPVIES